MARERDARFIERGNYATQLRRYLDLFGREQLLLLVLEEVPDDGRSTLQTVASFLGVDEGFFREGDWSLRQNQAAVYRSAGLYNYSVRLARALRRHSVTHNVMRWIKRTGMAEAVKSANRQSHAYPPLESRASAGIVNVLSAGGRQTRTDVLSFFIGMASGRRDERT